ncbi:uncharacterized protein LOC129903526 [Solanum dulcamara]|uniref:uncharacterized protein LOC129903526 n=1 Tax=Solanum dulcamara TaxID=45834 RepID=UPI00248524ED|nr:uncharacterized protein LOC129903526 [Solanum dulcamara]
MTKFANLLSGCPTLKLKRHWKLGLQFYRRILEILAPYLQHLEISGGLYDLRCILFDVSSVVTAKLTFNIQCIKDILDDHGQEFDPHEDSCYYHHFFSILVYNYLLAFRYANELTIGTLFTEMLRISFVISAKDISENHDSFLPWSISILLLLLSPFFILLVSLGLLHQVLCMLQFQGTPLPELKCKYLTLELHEKKFNLYGVAVLLRASPHVETHNIDISIEALNKDVSTEQLEDSHCHFELTYLAKGDDSDLQSWFSSFAFPNLKNVKIVNSSGVCFKDHFKQGLDKLFKLSEFLLKNATVLEKFVISKRIKCEICSMNCVSTCLSQLAEKLLGCPRSSTNCAVIY